MQLASLIFQESDSIPEYGLIIYNTNKIEDWVFGDAKVIDTKWFLLEEERTQYMIENDLKNTKEVERYFDRWNITNELQEEVHENILYQSCEVATRCVVHICAEREIECFDISKAPGYNEGDERFTEKAQDIFNELQEYIEEEMYLLVNNVYSLVKKDDEI